MKRSGGLFAILLLAMADGSFGSRLHEANSHASLRVGDSNGKERAKTGAELSKEEKQAIERELESLLEDARHNSDTLSFSGKINLSNRLAGFQDDRMITSEVQERSRFVVNWIIEKVRSGYYEHPEDNARDAHLLRELFFSMSPCIFSYIPLPNQIEFLAKADRIPELRESLVGTFLGEVNYELSYAHHPEKILKGCFDELSLSTRLDFLDFLPTLSAYGYGEGEWSNGCITAVERVVHDVLRGESNFFVQAVAKKAHELILAQWQRENGNEDKVGIDEAGGGSDALQEEKEVSVLQGKITPVGTGGSRLDRISRDAVGVFDVTDSVQGFARLSVQEERAMPEIEGADQLLELERVAGDRRFARSPQALWWALTTLYRSKQEVDWAERIPVFSADQWKRYWDLETRIQEMIEPINQLRAKPRLTKAEKKQLKALEWTCEQMTETLQPLMDILYRHPATAKGIREMIAARPHPPELTFRPFERFEENHELLPRGEKEGIDAAELLRVIHRPYVRRELEQKMGLSLSDLSLREQIQLLSFLASADRHKQEAGFQLISRYGLIAARSFLSCEYGSDAGDAILLIRERAMPRVVEALLQRYADLWEQSEKTASVLATTFYVDSAGKQVDQGRLQEDLLRRGKKLIMDFGERLTSASDTPDWSSESLLQALDRAEIDLEVFASLFRTVSVQHRSGQRPSIPFEELKGVIFEPDRLSEEISSDDKQQMLSLFEENWKKQRSDIAPYLLRAFSHKLASGGQDTRFSLVKKDGKVIAFLRFDARQDLGERAEYAASLNVRSSIRGSFIGEALVEQTIRERSADHPVFAHVLPDLDVATAYVEHMGAVIIGVDETSLFGSERRIQQLGLKWDASENAVYKARKAGVSWIDLLNHRVPGVEVLQFDVKNDRPAMLKAIEEVAAQGKVVSRFSADPVQPNIRLLAIEPKQRHADELREFKQAV